ncbi:MAG: hypothetical protein Q8P32_01000 [Candidatus Komeilibacteria bacterium]|nr:hypothetical protein [Candidatus Komeilibacteria bacterium]
MISFEQPQQIHPEKISTKEQILSNPAFIRFAGGFESYRDLLNINSDDKNKEAITERMLDFYTSRLNNVNKETQRSAVEEELFQIINIALQECRENNFSKDNFANRLATSSVINLFLSEWNRQESEVEEGSDMIHVNELIAYKKEGENEISLHIRPTGTESTELISKIFDGFQKIGSKLETGEIKADRIIMKSWLFNKKMEKITRLILGNKISIENTLPDDNDVTATQHLALQYNKKSLEKFLKTGEKPEVRQVIMTRDEFVARFKKI